MTFAGFDTARSIAEAVLYEGYLLYPYRKGALKNHLRWTLGGIQPSRTEGEPDRTFAQTECLAQAHDGATLTVRVKFLHLVAARSLGEEAVERELTLGALRLDEVLTERIFPFAFSAEHPEQLPVRGHVAVLAGRLADTLYRVRVRLTNQSGALPGEQASSASSDLARTLLAAHTLLGLRGGSFVSMIDPPAAWSEYASACSNVGTWPVLVGKPAKDVMLSCPIILYDYPEIAAESAGDLFDSTEIDEILTLRILTLADDEKREIRGADLRARELLERTERLTPE
ncbi:MAG TPA: hypothetical protein VJT73_11555, partial [Polyangiaceae bacterium]|nr:hypothetical protein [Polyangiaceae bacterium]